MQLFYFGESSNIYIAILKRHKIEGKADRTAAKCDREYRIQHAIAVNIVSNKMDPHYIGVSLRVL